MCCGGDTSYAATFRSGYFAQDGLTTGSFTRARLRRPVPSATQRIQHTPEFDEQRAACGFSTGALCTGLEGDAERSEAVPAMTDRVATKQLQAGNFREAGIVKSDTSLSRSGWAPGLDGRAAGSTGWFGWHGTSWRPSRETCGAGAIFGVSAQRHDRRRP